MTNSAKATLPAFAHAAGSRAKRARRRNQGSKASEHKEQTRQAAAAARASAGIAAGQSGKGERSRRNPLPGDQPTNRRLGTLSLRDAATLLGRASAGPLAAIRMRHCGPARPGVGGPFSRSPVPLAGGWERQGKRTGKEGADTIQRLSKRPLLRSSMERSWRRWADIRIRPTEARSVRAVPAYTDGGGGEAILTSQKLSFTNVFALCPFLSLTFSRCRVGGPRKRILRVHACRRCRARSAAVARHKLARPSEPCTVGAGGRASCGAGGWVRS